MTGAGEVEGGLTRLGAALNVLGSSHRALYANPAGSSGAKLTSQANGVYSALKPLEARVSRVRGGAGGFLDSV